jgi:acyl-CoA synthetase (AMP-forming)/AMP-acid ligase II
VNILGQLSTKLFTARTLVGAGLLNPARPDRLLKVGLTLQRWGPTLAAGAVANAQRYPGETAVIDELGTLTWKDVHLRSNALANALADAGVVEGDGIAILCRNHRGFIDATLACAKLGAQALYLNTAFAGPQITDVVQREKPVAMIYDHEFEALCADAAKGRKRFVAWHEAEDKPKDPLLEDLVAAGDDSDPLPPESRGRIIILTSGTTGAPKGAQRGQPSSLDPVAALLSKIPLKAREPTHIAAPMFHSWGMAHFALGISLSSTMVLRRRFDPEDMLGAVAQHECTALAVVPVMLQRTLELPVETIDRYDTSSLRVIAASGSALPGELALKVMDRFGDVLYNLYGSTEVAWATIATPDDLRAAPGSAGRPPRGTIVKLVDEDGVEVPTGETGRIFVGNEMVFEGYTGGGNKQLVAGLMSSGDVGHFDARGRLFVDGRDDEMIVSGGENVFPREVEDLLADHEAVDDVAIIGVPDEEFGQRLSAFVVCAPGGKVTESELKDYVKRNLARYKVPREIHFVDELPRNATGKVLKRELAERDGG